MYGAIVRIRTGAVAITITSFALALIGAATEVAPAAASTPARPVHVTGLSRHSEPTWGGDWITVRGSGFSQSGGRAVAAAYFGRYKAIYTRVINDHTIVAQDPEVDGARKVVRVVVQLHNGTRSKPSAAGTFTFTVPNMHTPAHNGLSTLQSRARGTSEISRVAATKAPALAPRHASWTLAEGRSVVARAKRWLGMPYSWGGGNTSGPTYGSPYGDGLLGTFDATFRGFDCSGLTLYAWAPYRAMPHYAATQHTVAGRFHPTRSELQPGDLLFFSAGGSLIDHVVIYAGRGKVIQAPESGHLVEVSSLAQVLSLEPRYLGATRPASTGRQGPGPKVISLSSTKGPAAGGETITIRGRNLTTTSRVIFGGTTTYAFQVLSGSRLRVKVPAGAGTVPVRLGNAWGVSPKTNADRFTYTK